MGFALYKLLNRRTSPWFKVARLSDNAFTGKSDTYCCMLLEKIYLIYDTLALSDNFKIFFSCVEISGWKEGRMTFPRLSTSKTTLIKISTEPSLLKAWFTVNTGITVHVVIQSQACISFPNLVVSCLKKKKKIYFTISTWYRISYQTFHSNEQYVLFTYAPSLNYVNSTSTEKQVTVTYQRSLCMVQMWVFLW